LHEEQKLSFDMRTQPTLSSTQFIEEEQFPRKRQLMAFIQDNTRPLLGTLHAYVHRFGLASGRAVQGVALEVLQETVVEALAHADRFIVTGQPMAWLLGIAVNVIRRKKVEEAKRYQRELLFYRLTEHYPELATESDLLDQLMPSRYEETAQAVEANEQAETLLSLVSADDQQLLRLAILEDYEREALAQTLGITPGTARMRLHRALRRLRSAWHEQQTTLARGESNE